MAKTPYARTHGSETREDRMRADAPRLLVNAGFQVSGSRIARGMQLIDATSATGERIVAWVKCAWAPGKHGTCAVQVDFPGPDRRPKDMEGVARIVEEKAARAADQGATHLLTYAANNAATEPLAAYLLPIAKVVQVTRESIEIAPNLVKNGHSPSLYVVADTYPKSALVAIVQRHSTDLLRLEKLPRSLRADTIDDLDQVPPGSEAPGRQAVVGQQWDRDPKIRAFVLRRANGQCEYCGQAGFLMPSGERFLEAHHIITLADQGPDTVENVIALCANHHREAHYGANSVALEREMLQVLVRLKAKPAV